MDTRTVSMDSKGIMQQVRELLAQGRSSGEVIALGYAPPTVYKVQRQLGCAMDRTPVGSLAQRAVTRREVSAIGIHQDTALGASEKSWKSLVTWMASKDSQLDDLSVTVEALSAQIEDVIKALPHDDPRICICCHHPFNKCTCLHPPTEG